MSDEVKKFFTTKVAIYDRFVSVFRYAQGLRAYWMESDLPSNGMRVLDAGCGTGMLTFAFLDALEARGLTPESMHAFDLTPAMLERLRARLDERDEARVELHEANVLELDVLPAEWEGYDLVISASMLEYVPRDQFVDAIRGLRDRLKEGGTFVLFITRDNPLMQKIIGGPWHANLYTRPQLDAAFHEAGFEQITFARFPLSYLWLRPWGHIVEARK